MTELTDQGDEIEVTAPLHSREWCEAVWPLLLEEIAEGYSEVIWKSAGPRGKDAVAEEWGALIASRRIHPNSEQFNGIMANCSEEFREAARSKMNG